MKGRQRPRPEHEDEPTSRLHHLHLEAPDCADSAIADGNFHQFSEHRRQTKDMPRMERDTISGSAASSNRPRIDARRHLKHRASACQHRVQRHHPFAVRPRERAEFARRAQAGTRQRLAPPKDRRGTRHRRTQYAERPRWAAVPADWRRQRRVRDSANRSLGDRTDAGIFPCSYVDPTWRREASASERRCARIAGRASPCRRSRIHHSVRQSLQRRTARHR